MLIWERRRTLEKSILFSYKNKTKHTYPHTLTFQANAKTTEDIFQRKKKGVCAQYNEIQIVSIENRHPPPLWKTLALSRVSVTTSHTCANLQQNQESL